MLLKEALREIVSKIALSDIGCAVFGNARGARTSHAPAPLSRFPTLRVLHHSSACHADYFQESSLHKMLVITGNLGLWKWSGIHLPGFYAKNREYRFKNSQLIRRFSWILARKACLVASDIRALIVIKNWCFIWWNVRSAKSFWRKIMSLGLWGILTRYSGKRKASCDFPKGISNWY